MVNDYGYTVDMRMNTVSTRTVVDLEGCEHREDTAKIPAHIMRGGKAMHCPLSEDAEFVKDIEDESAGEEVRVHCNVLY